MLGRRMVQWVLAASSVLLCAASCEDDPADASASTSVGAAGGALAADGTPCDDAAACASGHCADGVCCATACDGACEGCAVSGREGSCSPAPAGSDTDGECAGGSCDGAGSCVSAVHVWSRSFPGTEIHGVVSASDGSIVIAGLLRGTANLGGDDLVAMGNTDILVARFTAEGEHVWSKRFGTAGIWEVAYDLALDADGNVWVTGVVEGPVDFGGGSKGSTINKEDVFLLELDAAGNHLFSNVYGNIEQDQGNDIVVTADAVYLAGIHNYYVDFGGEGLLGPGFYLAKLDLSGGHIWSDSFGLHKNDTVTPWRAAIEWSPRGRLVMAGVFDGTLSFGGDDLTSQMQLATFLASFDADGNHAWSKAFAARSPRMALSADDTLYMTGWFEGTLDLGTGVLETGGAGASNIYFAAFDSSGQALWSKQFGDSLPDIDQDGNYGSDLAIDDNGVISMTGGVEGNTDFGGETLTAAGNDALLARFTSDGTHLFSAIYGDDAWQDAGRLALLSDGFVVTGYCKGTIDLGGGPLDCTGPTATSYIARFASSP